MPVSDEVTVRDGRRLLGRWPLLVVAGYLLAADACYLIATSRWGSYVGVPHRPVYVGDILFGASLITWLLGRGPLVLWREARRSPLLWTALALVAWTLLRLATGSINTVALRDAAPYLYLLAIPVTVTARMSGRHLVSMAVAAIAVHVGWLAIALTGPSWLGHLPHLGPTQLFQLRDDYDETVAGIAACVGLVGALRSSRWAVRACWLMLTAVGVWDISQMTSRGGVLAALTCLLVVALAIVWAEQLRVGTRRDRALRTGAGLALCAAVGVAFLQSPGVHRLSFGISSSKAARPGQAHGASPTVHPSVRATPSSDGQPAQRPGGSSSAPSSTASPTATSSSSPRPSAPLSSAAETAGTTAARKLAWREVVDYTTRTPERTLIGVGFGPNFLQAAGALKLLSGGIPGLRAPHNILLNTWARLGIVGLALNLVLLALAVVAAAKYVRGRATGWGILWVLVVVGFMTAAMVGVILEAPFGALPFAFAVGRLHRLPAAPAGPAVEGKWSPGRLQPQGGVR